jgi:phage terminase small subunit
MSELTPKQQRFVEEYLIDLNATQAAIRAGYSADTAHAIGWENLRKPEIEAAITALRKAQAERTRIDADYVLGTIRETVERCRQAEPVIDRRGEPVLTETPDGSLAKAYAFDSKGVLKGCELLGRNLALWKDRVEHTGKDGGPIETKQLDDSDLAREVAFLFASALKRQDTVQ